RANHENYRLWSTLKRLGFQPQIINDEQFEGGAWAAAPALVLSRCLWMDPRHLDFIVSNVVPSGIHVHASADLPGQLDAYGNPNVNWTQNMDSLFGLDVSRAKAPWDAGAVTDGDTLNHPQRLNFASVHALGSLTNGYTDSVATWKIWQGLASSSGVTV